MPKFCVSMNVIEYSRDIEPIPREQFGLDKSHRVIETLMVAVDYTGYLTHVDFKLYSPPADAAEQARIALKAEALRLKSMHVEPESSKGDAVRV